MGEDGTLVAVTVRGDKNETRLTFPAQLTDAVLDSLADIVKRKDPSRSYYVTTMFKRRRGFAKGDALYEWHVGDGFSHAEGWWIRMGEGS